MVKTWSTGQCVECSFHMVQCRHHCARPQHQQKDQKNGNFPFLLADMLDKSKIHLMSTSSENDALNKNQISFDLEYVTWMAAEQNKSEIFCC